MNKPVAWMDKNDRTRIQLEQEWADDIPLYTHPVKELNEEFEKGFKAGKEEGWKAHKFHHLVKELTDEEILSVWDEDCVVLDEDKLVIRFAKAILRKAQEK